MAIDVFGIALQNPFADAGDFGLEDIRFGFNAGFVLELREDGKSEAVSTYTFPLNPRVYNLSEPFLSDLTPTEGNTVIPEENGIIMREITLEGTTGYSVKTPATFQSSQAQGEASGNKHFITLREFFRRYSIAKQNPNLAEKTRMIFHSLKEDDHFVVVPKSFDMPRDAQRTRIHYEYRISLTAIGNVEFEREVPDDSFGFDDVLQGLNDARAAFAEATALVSEIKRKVGNINAVMLQAAGLINAVTNFANGAKALIESPFLQFQTGAAAIQQATDELGNALAPSSLRTGSDLSNASFGLRKMEQGFDLMMMQPENFGEDLGNDVAKQYDGERRLTLSDVNDKAAGADIGSRTRVLLGTGVNSGIDLGTFDSTLQVVILAGDTVESIATRNGSTIESIILVNNLQYPYIAPGGGPGVRQTGDELLVPVAAGGAPLSVTPADEFLTDAEVLYGIDMRLDPELLKQDILDIAVDDVHGGLDAELARGIANVVQGMQIILLTELGSTKFLPEIGIRRSVGQKGTLSALLVAAVNLREAILGDPRVESFDDFQVTLTGDVLNQEITPRLRGQLDGITVVVPFGSATGES